MRAVKAIIRTIVGLIFGAVSALALVPAFAAFSNADGTPSSAIIPLIVIVGGGALGFFAPSIRRAFGRGFLIAGLCILALPISTMMLSGRVSSDMIERAEEGTEAGTAIGSGLAGMALTGMSAFVGLFLGAIFIIIGLVLALGGRREVIVYERTQQ
ncbi:hypothetical protein JYP49_14165 [Nitratireductor aquimarinus]|uniref:hypothetical protein n=1 Tax=Nitratireductor TaxID=245876 RepID=UPI0019D3C424|nr:MULTISPECIES: hypothetical protein [Nitratireductor]MBN7777742.1 hypothetical protein [Nitratireductor pacificus]MBN7781736.1 hypothetical protein [Nitratireductor pacificus]MBN7790542.1 hypothetical protein [Nitratireductor aquimarinus]MBY6099952.1 hypothetical protein [Nitratireductor aquimarinus]MCA1260418.1 hypothetical protein [Nitratireductor aquimarinus]